MFKFGTIGAFKQVRNNPTCKATKELKNGMVVVLDEADRKAPPPANATEAQGNVWVVYNIIDQPEIGSSVDFVVAKDDFVRAFYLPDLHNLTVELDATVVSTDYSSISKDDVLVPNGDGSGKWIKADGTSIKKEDYNVCLEVLEKTTLGGQGLYCIVRVK